jgi:hypothetical protein
MTDKKELIRRYKQTIPQMGIFQIKNKTNGKLFIGKARDVNGIINSNKFQLKIGRHFNKELQADYNRLGEAGFDFEVLDFLKPKDDPNYDYSEDLRILEEMWLDKLQPFEDKGYHSNKKP